MTTPHVIVATVLTAAVCVVAYAAIGYYIGPDACKVHGVFSLECLWG